MSGIAYQELIYLIRRPQIQNWLQIHQMPVREKIPDSIICDCVKIVFLNDQIHQCISCFGDALKQIK
jgi:hypothetical protein